MKNALRLNHFIEITGLMFSSFVFFIYIATIITSAAITIMPYINISLLVQPIDLILLPIGFLIFVTLYVIQTRITLHKYPHKITKNSGILRLIIDTFIFYLVVCFTILVFQNTNINTIVKVFLITTLVFLGSFPFYNQTYAFTNTLYINIYFYFLHNNKYLKILSYHNKSILSYENFLLYTTITLNQANRYSQKLGVFAFSYNSNQDIAKQIEFLLSEISRSHENWLIIDDKSNTKLFLSLICFKSHEEFEMYYSRVEEEISSFKPVLNNSPLNINYKFYKKLFEENNLNNDEFEYYEKIFIDSTILEVKNNIG